MCGPADTNEVVAPPEIFLDRGLIDSLQVGSCCGGPPAFELDKTTSWNRETAAGNVTHRAELCADGAP